jgi:fibronectin-binding autotransporter adhesin
VSGGTLQNGVANAIPYNSPLTVNAGAQYDLNGFGQISLQIAGAGVITDSGAAATLVVGGTSATDATTPATVNSTFSGSITNSTNALALTKSGLGTLTLTGNFNTYTGATNVNAGTMVVSGSISGSSTVNVGTSGAAAGATLSVASTGVLGSSSALVHLVVGATGTLSGNGTVDTAGITTSSGAIVAPASGNSAGLTINDGPMTLSTGSTLQLSLANSNVGSFGAPALADYSKLTLGTGVSASITGASIAVTVATGAANAGDLFTVILNGGSAITTRFANTTLISGSTYSFTSNGEPYEINYAYGGSATASGITPAQFQAYTGGTNIAVLVLVPEPNSWSMLAGSLGVALGLQRFRRRRR